MRPFRAIIVLIPCSLGLVSCGTEAKVIPSDSVRLLDTSKGRFAEIPGGFTLPVVLETSICSATAKAGDRFTADTAEPVFVGEKLVIPAGATVHGVVTEITPPAMGLLKAKLVVSFDRLDVSGRRVPIKGKTTMDMGALAQKGAMAAGTYVAKEAAKSMIPVLGWIYLAQNIQQGVTFVTEDKELTLAPGTRFIMKIEEPFSVPY